MADYRDVFNKILEIIKYTGDREEFIDHFVSNIQKQSLLELIGTLPKDKQQEISEKISKINNVEELPELLKLYFTDEQITEKIKNVSKESISKYIESIESLLSSSQFEELSKISESVNLKD